ncbi:hypothetical protein NHX12_026225 [Muraenolepis orangiensis]|uniref:Lysosomal enzyme trafficking factor n=1 Tax=Muraenolepis orangiensis TaxID=630683 RepID=A0A9Q0EJ71_9TELE|nr:hypothetical protein NHX12_026225 [Muraenolepis orangiensis]
MMNFRQRMGWVGVGLYLLASALVLYCVFEMKHFSLELVEQRRRSVVDSSSSSSSAPLPPSSSWSLKDHLLPLPLWAWATLFLVPYLQVFLFLYSCTRADPKTIGYCILPVCLAVLINRHHSFTKASNQISRLQLIDT